MSVLAPAKDINLVSIEKEPFLKCDINKPHLPKCSIEFAKPNMSSKTGWLVRARDGKMLGFKKIQYYKNNKKSEKSGNDK